MRAWLSSLLTSIGAQKGAENKVYEIKPESAWPSVTTNCCAAMIDSVVRVEYAKQQPTASLQREPEQVRAAAQPHGTVSETKAAMILGSVTHVQGEPARQARGPPSCLHLG